MQSHTHPINTHTHTHTHKHTHTVLVIGFPQEVYDVTEDIGDAPITVQIISGELADGVSVDIFFSNQNVTVFGKRNY